MAQANWIDRVALALSPSWGAKRMRSRVVAETLRHFEAAQSGRRTSNWTRKHSDANAASVPALAALRAHSRDLVRNNAWARNALRVITRNTVGYGITPKPVDGKSLKKAAEIWKRWANTTQCDAAGRLTFAGLEKLVARTVAESGEAVILRRWRRPGDGLAIPMQIQVLEPDFIDSEKSGKGEQGGAIINGIEYDAIGRRVAYWLFKQHPGSTLASGSASTRHPADNVIHAYDVDRAGQERGVPWLAAAIVKLKDFDEFEDAQLVRQKIAACFAAFVTDPEGGPPPLGATDAANPLVTTLEPGLVQSLVPGQTVEFGTPPLTTDDGFSVRILRAIAAAVGVTYEDLTGDYSQVNFSSARMSRIAHWGNVYDWQWNILIPQFCDPAWAWAMEVAVDAGLLGDAPAAEWTPQPMPMTDPDREARANMLMVRSGQKTLSQVIREQGMDPESQMIEYAQDLKRLDDLGIWLDCDVRRVSQAGLTQGRPAGTGFPDEGGGVVPAPEESAAKDSGEPATEPAEGAEE
jgi:lambda family phage portal protein